MNWFDKVPLKAMQSALQQQVAERSGWEGGLLGAGLGAISVVVAMKAADREITVPMVLTGAVVGIAIGAADKSAITGDGPVR